jgi:phytoene dehydrogenase-like protein
MNVSASDPSALRYFDDEQIACVLHSAMRGLAYVLHQPLPPDWHRLGAARQRLVIEQVAAFKRREEAPARRTAEQRIRDELAVYIITGLATIQR